MKSVIIVYGSKKYFENNIPQKYRTLTDLIRLVDSKSKTLNIDASELYKLAEKKPQKKRKLKIGDFVAFSNEYGSVQEHVILNFWNFLDNFKIENLYLHNPPLQISNQIKMVFPNAKVYYEEYKSIQLDHLRIMDKEYNHAIIGQNSAKDKLLLALYPLTLKKRVKPVVILLYGNSGIGKTETARYISSLVGQKLFRKQFSMFQSGQFYTYLFGGSHHENSFTKDLLNRESNIILLDEFDKAHPSFHNAFYQLFDEGIYEDQYYSILLGKAVIICTSNYTSLDEIEKNLGSPIYNRFDSVIKFDDLSDDSKEIIANKIINEKQIEYEVVLDDEIKNRLLVACKKCTNVRQISKIIEETYALICIKKI